MKFETALLGLLESDKENVTGNRIDFLFLTDPVVDK